MSTYTGRYVQSHGAAWNGFPLKVGEMTMGDYLRPLGMRTALVGKTHMEADAEGMARLDTDEVAAEVMLAPVIADSLLTKRRWELSPKVTKAEPWK